MGKQIHMTKFDEGSQAENAHGIPLPDKKPCLELPDNEHKKLRPTPIGLDHPHGNSRDGHIALSTARGDVPRRNWPQSLRVGYAAGAYDLFHIGHLNILRQAKQRCDYLIAGVVSDEMLSANKGIDPFIPEEERLAIVRSIEFVDEAILETLPDKLDTWNSLRFTVFFKGDDWRGTPKGLDLEKRFGEVGVDIEYLPYTLHTSSTKLRLALENFERAARTQ